MPTILLSPSFCSEVRVLLYLQTLPCIFHASFICIFVSSLSSALGPQHDIELLQVVPHKAVAEVSRIGNV